MSDPNEDWLDVELKNLRDLEAPRTLLPTVLKTVRQHARIPWWARPFELRADLFRSFFVVISLLVMASLLVVNPVQYFSGVPIAAALLKLMLILLDTAKAVLLQTKVYHFSVLTLLLPPIVLSYVLLVATASTIQRLARVRK
jgi:hypothetical protein